MKIFQPKRRAKNLGMKRVQHPLHQPVPSWAHRFVERDAGASEP